MKDHHNEQELINLIAASMKMTEKPSAALNDKVKRDMYRKEQEQMQRAETRAVSLWYIPMVLNLITFTLFAAISLLTIENPYSSRLVAILCGYIGIAGILITLIAVRRTNLKETITIHIRKRGVLT